MDLVGARFRPLSNSPRYGPKTWKQDSEGVWVEQEMTEEEKGFAALESTLLWASPSYPFRRTTPITEEDAEKFPICKDYIDGFAVFPNVAGFDVSTDGGKAAARKQESEWEKRAQVMHENQGLVLPPDKPTDGSTTGKYFRELKRGD